MKRQENRAAYMFLTPWLIGLFGITLIPIFASLYLSFTDYGILNPPKWVGFDNYIKLFTGDRRFLKSIWVTLAYVGWSVPLILVFSLTIAVALNRGLAGPRDLPLAVLRAFADRRARSASDCCGAKSSASAACSTSCSACSASWARGWITNPTWALPSVIGLHVWTFGASMVIFLAALRQIPESYYEAASIDGANAWQRFWRITLPLITPVLFFNTILLIIGSFQGFTQAFVVSRGQGGPIDSTLLYSLYLYQRAFQQLDMGYASAMAWILLLAIAAITALLLLDLALLGVLWRRSLAPRALRLRGSAAGTGRGATMRAGSATCCSTCCCSRSSSSCSIR